MIPSYSYVEVDQNEHRQFQRVAAIVAGRYMLQDRQDYPCQTTDISPGDLLMNCPVRGAVGEKVIAYLDHIGRIEGQILRHTTSGFAMSISATFRKRDKLAAQLTWIANHKALGLPEDRRHERIPPKNPRSELIMDDGVVRIVRLIDISLSGAAISSELRPPLNMLVKLGRATGRVVRIIDGGFAIEFSVQLTEENLQTELN